MFTDIILDLGHGGVDEKGKYITFPNKMHKFDNGEVAYEGLINRQIGEKIYQFIKWDLDIAPHYTVNPNDPTDLSLEKRTEFVNSFNKNTTLLISVHSNAFNTEARGFEIFTTKKHTQSDILAEYIFESVERLYKKIALKLRYDITDGDKDKEADFYVLKKSKCPAVLLECLFFDNWEDYQMLKNKKFQTYLAYYIYLGIKKFVQNAKNL